MHYLYLRDHKQITVKVIIINILQMKKIIFSIIMLTIVAVGCQNATEKVENNQNDSLTAVVDEVALISVADFDQEAGNYVGKKIQMEGTIDHVCKHGGQRAFLVNTDSESRIKLTPDETLAAFNTEMEGNQVVIVGVVEEQRIDEAYIMEWEQEIKSGIVAADDKGEGSHLGGNVEKGGEGADINEEMEKVNNLRKMLEDSGSDHLSFYSVMCSSLKEVTAPKEVIDSEN
jgi:hypothetical protein